ncbi:MAG TPA: ATP-binding protein [Micromonosporaceae bacterium]|nr:ATP-binding protein [Micromonosporaceae bacterium]
MQETIHDVAAADLARIRQWVRRNALQVGLPAMRTEALTLAANEVITNAIRHGGGAASVTITTTVRNVVIEVRDRGTASFSASVAQPAPTEQRGRGLWLAQQLCDELVLSGSHDGMLVRLSSRFDPIDELIALAHARRQVRNA